MRYLKRSKEGRMADQIMNQLSGIYKGDAESILEIKKVWVINKRPTSVQFITELGIEESYSPEFDCMADAKDAEIEVTFI